MEEKNRFLTEIIQRAAFLEPFFCIEENNSFVNEAALRHYIASASDGEALMARFALGVWYGQNALNFDIIDAARTLDDRLMRVVTDWLRDPFWP